MWEVDKEKSITKPQHLHENAYLWESDQVKFKVYYWVEYIKTLPNGIHNIHVYDANGNNREERYYFSINTQQIDPSKPYIIEDLLSKTATLKAEDVTIDLYLFKTGKANDDYKVNTQLSVRDADFQPVTAYENNSYYRENSDLSKYSPAMDVWVRIVDKGADQFQISIQDEFGDLSSNIYLLCNDDVTKSNSPKFPFELKFFNITSERLFLVSDGWYLKRIK